MNQEAGGHGIARLLLFALLAPSAVRAGPAEEALLRSRTLRLWEDPGWSRLLHLKGGSSEASDAGFFLSPHGRIDPRLELEAEVSGLYDVPQGDGDNHVRCRFPARSSWLIEKLGLDLDVLPSADCPRYEEWRRLLDARSVSLIFASAYLDNPSSMFGHTFLRLERGATGSGERLLDNSLNFAADTGDDGGARFALKGLLGLYPGRYTMMPYYMKIQEYNNIENRDLWEYRLNLSSSEVGALAAHAWEMGQTSFPYYFFSKNCSYQLLPALEAAALRLSLTTDLSTVVSPVDTLLAVRGVRGLACEARYRPSHATLMRQRRALLTGPERRAAEAFVRGKSEEADVLMAGFPPARRALVLDCAQDYVLYKKGFSPAVPDSVRAIERPILLRRAKVSEPPTDPPPPSWAAPPEEGHARRRLRLGFGAHKRGAFTELSWRPGYHDLLDRPRGFVPGAAIEGLSFRLRYDQRDHRFFVDDARLVEILSVSPWDPWMRKPSWGVGTGLDTAYELGRRADDSLVYEGHLGTGLAAEVLPGSLAYVLASGEGAVGVPLRDGWRLGGGLRCGIVGDWGTGARAVLEAGLAGFPIGDRTPNHRLRLGLNWAVSRSLAWRSEFFLRGDHREAGLYAVLYH